MEGGESLSARQIITNKTGEKNTFKKSKSKQPADEAVITYINGCKQRMTKGELQNIISQRKFDYMINNTNVELEDNTIFEKMIITKTRLKDRIEEGLKYVRNYEKLDN